MHSTMFGRVRVLRRLSRPKETRPSTTIYALRGLLNRVETTKTMVVKGTVLYRLCTLLAAPQETRNQIFPEVLHIIRCFQKSFFLELAMFYSARTILMNEPFGEYVPETTIGLRGGVVNR